jgi:hypothetical protein
MPFAQFVVVPNLKAGERIELFGWISTKDTSPLARLMPAESGDLVLRGVVTFGADKREPVFSVGAGPAKTSVDVKIEVER